MLRSAILAASALLGAALVRKYVATRQKPRETTPQSPDATDAGGAGAANIVISNRAAYERKRRAFVARGAQRLQIISDFDRTLTAFASASSHGVLEHSPVLPAEYRALTKALFEKYYPLETSLSLSIADKTALMVEWWSQAHALLQQYELKQRHVLDSVAAGIASRVIYLRDGAAEVFRVARERHIPLSILSAGLGNVISAFLQQVRLFELYVRACE